MRDQLFYGKRHVPLGDRIRGALLAIALGLGAAFLFTDCLLIEGFACLIS